MTTKCEHCNGAGREPGHIDCAWCDNSGRSCGLDTTRYSAVQLRFATGELAKSAFVEAHELDAALAREAALKETLERWLDLDKARDARCDALQQRLTAADERADGFDHRIARLRHVGMELTGVIDEYRAMPCDSLKVRMFQTADRYRKRLTAKCGNCEDHGVIGYTTGQTPETFDQGEYPCPECHPTEYAAWRKP